MKAVLLAGMCGAVIGAAAAAFLLPHRESLDASARDRRARPSEAEATPGTEPSRASALPRDVEDAASRVEVGSRDSIFDDRLRAYATSELRAGWSSVRADSMPANLVERGVDRVRSMVVDGPRAIGVELAERTTKVDLATARSRGLGALEQLRQGFLSGAELASDTRRFDSIFDRATAEAFIDGEQALQNRDARPGDGATLTFGPGIFDLHLQSVLQPPGSPPPRDLTIAGAGMDQTLLLSDGATLSEPLLRFAVRDCTVYGSRGEVVDLRGDGILLLDRVRIVGFDTGAGGSCALYLMDAALHASDCRFEGGYGRNPGYGTLCRFSGRTLVARFDGCTFRSLCLAQGLHAPDSGGFLIFASCRFDEMLDPSPIEDALARLPGLKFSDCSFAYADRSKPVVPATELDRIFPRWRERARR